MAGAIVIKGARVHNLKNIDLEIPRDRLVVITGVSGSGKSSLAFDTLYAEGQRRYLESLGADARQLLQRLEQPDVDSIEGLSPTIAVQQRPGLASPRSTVGTLTDIMDYLRLLFARAGDLHCIVCARELKIHTIEQIVDQLLALPAQTRLVISAPVPLSSPAAVQLQLREYTRQGFARVLIDGEMRELSEETDLATARRLDLVVDRLVIRDGIEKRLADSLETAARHGGQVIRVQVLDGGKGATAKELAFNLASVCPHCGAAMPEITPGLFSFNSPEGACPRCNGLGVIARSSGRTRSTDEEKETMPCPECGGARLRKESHAVKIGGRDIVEISALPIATALEFFSRLIIGEERRTVGQKILDQMLRRFHVMADLGLQYLSLERSTNTLSGGELQRVRLATQIGAAMAGVLYVLDEPSLGLHQRDNSKLLALLKRLRDIGNTVLVVEHDRETMLAADHLIDMGPAAGARGGEVIAQGTPAEVASDQGSLTGGYLAGRLRVPVPSARGRGSGEFVTIQNANAHNLKNLTVAIPIGAMTCVTGVSGAGKSTMVMEVLYRGVAARLRRGAKGSDSGKAEITGWEHFTRVIGVDQTPIGRTARSNPATYTGIHDYLRELFAQLPEARVRGYGSERFSFNVSGGRCEACAGEGVTRVEMHFLPELYVTCAVCRGRRYNRETLSIKYKGLSVADVLDLTVDQALELLGNVPAIHDRLRALRDVGLGYIQLGQPASRLAGGEAQRVKLARELARRSTGRSLYVLDEPTAGLHFDDVKTLLELLHRLTDLGNTTVIVEHNLDVIKNADHVIDLGPGGGTAGGELIAEGRPEEIAAVLSSVTGQYLKEILPSG
jgi:excinuclease ABC subunit A